MYRSMGYLSFEVESFELYEVVIPEAESDSKGNAAKSFTFNSQSMSSQNTKLFGNKSSSNQIHNFSNKSSGSNEKSTLFNNSKSQEST